jgi:hypothetical protein
MPQAKPVAVSVSVAIAAAVGYFYQGPEFASLAMVKPKTPTNMQKEADKGRNGGEKHDHRSS